MIKDFSPEQILLWKITLSDKDFDIWVNIKDPDFIGYSEHSAGELICSEGKRWARVYHHYPTPKTTKLYSPKLVSYKRYTYYGVSSYSVSHHLEEDV